jgi:hypothetical protein
MRATRARRPLSRSQVSRPALSRAERSPPGCTARAIRDSVGADGVDIAEKGQHDVTLDTLHQDLGELKGLLASGLRAFPSQWPGEVLRLLREGNRLNEERFAQLDVAWREQAVETQTTLRAITETLRAITESQRLLVDGQRQLSEDIRALIARIDALIRGRDDGAPSR